MSHRYEIYTVRNMANNYVMPLHVIYHSDHFEMYRIIDSLCYTTGTNIMLWVNYTSKTNKQIHRKIGQICGYLGREGQRR